MPAPRAVLTDIQNLGLDPKVAHKNLDKSGCLKGQAVEQVEHKQKVEKKELTVSIPEPVIEEVAEVVVTPVVTEEPVKVTVEKSVPKTTVKKPAKDVVLESNKDKKPEASKA